MLTQNEKVFQLHNEKRFHHQRKARYVKTVLTQKVLLAPIPFGAGIKVNCSKVYNLDYPMLLPQLVQKQCIGNHDWNGLLPITKNNL